VPSDAQLNPGVIAVGVKQPAPAARTIIVTGIARSGTSMVARVLRGAGLFMGEFMHQVVNEDSQVLEMLRNHNLPALQALVAQRNAAHAAWGFKVPNLHAHLAPGELGLFRNPHLVLIYRDPVAIAVRSAISDHYDPLDSLLNTAAALDTLTRYGRRAGCPMLLLSYEKALTMPDRMLDLLLVFCGLSVTKPRRKALLAEIRASHPEYLAIASTRFAGNIDGVQDGQLCGWCVQEGRGEPVRLDILANNILLRSVTADRYRDDLSELRVGTGCHGFLVDLAPYRLPPEAVLRVRVRDRVFELPNSGKPLGAYPAMAGG
jgi:hypothetical protein